METLHTEFKFSSIEEDGTIAGYGSVYDNIDKGGDVITKGAFDKSLAEFKAQGKTPKMLWQHDPSQPIGIWKSIVSDEKGIRVEGQILESISKGKETLAMLRAGIVDGLSIGYQTVKASREQKDGRTVRVLKELNLWEVSVVTFPMNALATVTDVKQLQSPRDVESILRKAGVPVNFAKLVAIHGYDEAVNRLNSDYRDDDDEAKRQKDIKELMASLNGLKEIFNA